MVRDLNQLSAAYLRVTMLIAPLSSDCSFGNAYGSRKYPPLNASSIARLVPMSGSDFTLPPVSGSILPKSFISVRNAVFFGLRAEF